MSRVDDRLGWAATSGRLGGRPSSPGARGCAAWQSGRGLELRKSRRRDPRAKDYGRWYIVDVDREIEAAEIGGYDVATESFTAHRRALEIARAEFVVKECDDLDVVEAFLTDDGRQS